MKKIFVIAAFAGLVFASCTKTDVAEVKSDTAAEVTFSPFAGAMKASVKGYVIAGAGFTDGGDVRDMQVSGFIKNTDEDFFVDRKFEKNTAAGVWKASPSIYYPLGKTDNYGFLAFSDAGKTTYKWNGAKSVDMNVDSASLKYDILASKVDTTGNTIKENGGGALNMKFHHTQSWLTVTVTAKDSSTNAAEVKVTAIKLKNIFNVGKLTLAWNSSTDSSDCKPTINWDFFGLCKCESLAMSNGYFDTVGTTKGKWVNNTTVGYGVKLDSTKTPYYFEGLYPANQTPSALEICYTMGSDPKIYSAIWDLENAAKWEPGKHYTINVKIGMYEVMITPSVGEWVEVTPTTDVAIW